MRMLVCSPCLLAVALGQPQPKAGAPGAEPVTLPVFRAPSAALDWYPPAGFKREDDPETASRPVTALGVWHHPATGCKLMLVLCTTEDLVTAEEREPGPSVSGHRAVWLHLLGQRVFPDEPQARVKTPAGEWERRKLDENLVAWTLDAAPRAIGVVLQSPSKADPPAAEVANAVEGSLESLHVAPIQEARTALVPLKIALVEVGKKTFGVTLPLPPGGGFSPGSATPVYSAMRFPAGHAEHVAVWWSGAVRADTLPRESWETAARNAARAVMFTRDVRLSTAAGPDVVLLVALPETNRSPYGGERYCHAIWQTGDLVLSLGWAGTGKQTAAALEELALEAVRGARVVEEAPAQEDDKGRTKK